MLQEIGCNAKNMISSFAPPPHPLPTQTIQLVLRQTPLSLQAEPDMYNFITNSMSVHLLQFRNICMI